jgi:hypothetical protein
MCATGLTAPSELRDRSVMHGRTIMARAAVIGIMSSIELDSIDSTMSQGTVASNSAMSDGTVAGVCSNRGASV